MGTCDRRTMITSTDQLFDAEVINTTCQSTNRSSSRGAGWKFRLAKVVMMMMMIGRGSASWKRVRWWLRWSIPDYQWTVNGIGQIFHRLRRCLVGWCCRQMSMSMVDCSTWGTILHCQYHCQISAVTCKWSHLCDNESVLLSTRHCLW